MTCPPSTEAASTSAPAVINPLSWAMWLLAEALERGDPKMPPISRWVALDLGRRLRQVADGGNPEVLRQRQEPWHPIIVAFWYHYERILTPRFSVSRAMTQLRRHHFPGLSPSTIRKYGQQHRDHVLGALERGVSPFDIASDNEVSTLWADFVARVGKEHGAKIRRYREYLRRKSPR